MNRIFWLSMGFALLGAVGCGYDPSGTSGDGGTEPRCPDDPADRAVPEDCGIWVSASIGDDANAGTQAAPVASLLHAIELAAKGPGQVYACNETWTDPLVLPGNVSLHGGFDCANGWGYGKGKRATVAPTVPAVAVLVVDGGEAAPPFFTDMSVRAVDAVEPGASSIAVFVRDDVSLNVRRSDIHAGNGADGLDGAPGGPNGEPGQAGLAGNEGGNACAAATSKGGASPVTACADGVSKGGMGGDSTTMTAADGAPGEPASTPPGGAGGTGEQSNPSCTAGKAGTEGAEGGFGLGARGFGHLTVNGYAGVPGEDGNVGGLGNGGGGGGATFGKAAVCGAGPAGGAAGGSGGAGGCGGKGGKGGQPGGASIAFAILTVTQPASLLDVDLYTGNGGKGGNGGPPQLGGMGGDPGDGGAGAGAGSIKAGCPGGTGGAGGKGGWGGGGLGGGSMTVAGVKPHGPNVAIDEFHHHNGHEGAGGTGDPLHHEQGDGESGHGGLYEPLDP